ncbi:MAG: DUF4124 domain-containing protein [Rhodanobacteraceae bacterium]
MKRLRLVSMLGVAWIAAGCRDREPSTPPQPAAESVAPAAVVAAPEQQSPPPLPTSAIAAEPPRIEPSAACVAKTSGNGSRSQNATIHRWVDATGITHYSDQAPAAGVSNHRVLEVAGLPPVKIEASGYDVNLPADVERRAVVDALGVQRAFHDVLDIDAPTDMTMRIVFVGDAGAYQKLIGDSAPAGSAGAYVPDRQTIYVRMQPDDETAFSVLRHEITHALIHEEIGNLTISLNEGLAEYFRRYRAAGMGGEIDLAADRRALIAAAPNGEGADALVELLAFSGPEFYATDRERRYLEAYGLAAVLMQGGDATAALRELLVRQRADPCRPVPAESVIDEKYPGGLAALARDWTAFLRDPPASVRAY